MEAKQLGHGRPEQVGVENANGKSELRKPDRKIAGDGRLAHASLTRGDRDDVLDAGQRFARPAVPDRRRFAFMGVTLGMTGEAPATVRAASAVSVTTAPATPGIALIVASARARIGSIALARAGSMAIAANTLPSRMVTPETAPDSGKDARPSGPGIRRQRSHDLVARNHLSPSRSPRPSARSQAKSAASVAGRQSSVFRNVTTVPTIMIAGPLSSAARAFAARVPSAPTTTR